VGEAELFEIGDAGRVIKIVEGLVGLADKRVVVKSVGVNLLGCCRQRGADGKSGGESAANHQRKTWLELTSQTASAVPDDPMGETSRAIFILTGAASLFLKRRLGASLLNVEPVRRQYAGYFLKFQKEKVVRFAFIQDRSQLKTTIASRKFETLAWRVMRNC
jgi:hypothetical protein